MEDAEISLKVARVLWPEHQWHTAEHGRVWRDCPEIQDSYMQHCVMYFDYRTDDALGKMAVWFRRNAGDSLHSKTMWQCLATKNPNRALADEIITAGERNGD